MTHLVRVTRAEGWQRARLTKMEARPFATELLAQSLLMTQAEERWPAHLTEPEAHRLAAKLLVLAMAEPPLLAHL